MLRFQIVFALVIFVLAFAGADNVADIDDANLEAFKNADRQKRSVTDLQTLVRCSVPLADDDDDHMAKSEQAKKLGVCLARAALKKEMEGDDSASDMVRRLSELTEKDEASTTVARRGWFRKAVKKVSGWVKKNKDTIKKGIAIAGTIIKVIWGK